MGKTRKIDLGKKYRRIFFKEQSLARTVAHAVIKLRPISVWEVMIPLLLVFSFAKTKETREVFTQNFLFTKRLALKAAQDIIEKGQQKKEILLQVEDETMRLLSSIKEGIYSEEVRLKQMAEITLLIDHYCLLIDAEGNDYTSWVINAYQSPGNYIAFLEQLKQAEKEVYGAAMQTVGTQTSAEMVATMEKTTERIRMAAAEKIFRTTN